MAVMYDPQTLDLHDASVADRLRKQAKTRAVKVLRESIANKSLGEAECLFSIGPTYSPLFCNQDPPSDLDALAQLVV